MSSLIAIVVAARSTAETRREDAGRSGPAPTLILGLRHVRLLIGIEFAELRFEGCEVQLGSERCGTAGEGKRCGSDLDEIPVGPVANPRHFSSPASPSSLAAADVIFTGVRGILRKYQIPELAATIAAVDAVTVDCRDGEFTFLQLAPLRGATGELEPLALSLARFEPAGFPLALPAERADSGNRHCKVRKSGKLVGSVIRACT